MEGIILPKGVFTAGVVCILVTSFQDDIEYGVSSSLLVSTRRTTDELHGFTRVTAAKNEPKARIAMWIYLLGRLLSELGIGHHHS